MIKLNFMMEDMPSSALFHVIEARTSYPMQLGQPWLCDYGIVPSSLHQYFKYYHNRVQ